MLVSTLKSSLYTWLAPVLPTATVIFADQAAPEPAQPFATIKIGTLNKLGQQDELVSTDSNGIQTRQGQRTVIVSLQFIGSGAQDLARLAQNSLQKESVLSSLFYTAGLALVDDGTIINLTDLLETKYEERAALDITFRYADEFTDDVGLIESVEVVGQLGGGSQPDDIEPEIDITVSI